MKNEKWKIAKKVPKDEPEFEFSALAWAWKFEISELTRDWVWNMLKIDENNHKSK